MFAQTSVFHHLERLYLCYRTNVVVIELINSLGSIRPHPHHAMTTASPREVSVSSSSYEAVRLFPHLTGFELKSFPFTRLVTKAT